MNTPKFLITNYLNSFEGSQEELRKKLFEKGVLTKDYNDDGLMLLYHKYESPVSTELERECRSLIIDNITLKLKSYTCETPRLNKDGMDYLISNSTEPQIITQCYEGTYLSVFNHNGKWYVSTRRCLNSQESMYTNQDKSHFDMFMDVIKNSGYETFNDFTSELNPENSYYFVLIHHENKHIIDYTNLFGENYGRLCLTTVRDSEMCELDIYENKLSFVSYTNNESNIFVPEKLESIDGFANNNKVIKYNESPESEGIIIRVWNNQMSKYYLIKLQNINYQFAQAQGVGIERNIFKGLIYLYQNDKLIDYFNQNPNSQNIKKIINPLNLSESYDTIGMVDAVFKVCTSELFELFKVLWSIKNGKHQNKELYNILPKEYKDIMFAIRGIYYKKKALLHTYDKNVVTIIEIKKTHLKINDIYNYLKSLPTETIVAFLRMRKLMLNWGKTDVDKLKDFMKTSVHCDKVHMKLCAIFTNKLYPNIMPNDIPPQKDMNLSE